MGRAVDNATWELPAQVGAVSAGAARLDTRREIVSKWRKRFFEEGLPGLEERSRDGRPPLDPP